MVGLFWGWPSFLMATENAGTNKVPGVDTVLVGVMPPPGWRLTTTFAYYTADKTMDGSGNRRSNVTDFYYDIKALTMRFQYVWPNVEWLGAAVETRFGHAIYAEANFRIQLQTPGGAVRREAYPSASFAGGFAAPVLLGWHGKTLHQTAGALVIYPTRTFNRALATNIPSGYVSLAPAYFVTWMPNERWELNGSLFYLHNFENHVTNYQSGRETSFDYGIGYSVSRKVQLGLNGYIFKQLADDEINGIPVAGGNRGQAVAIGPFVRFQVSRNFGLVLKWQQEFKVENRGSGNRFFLQINSKLW
jgi:hypothetical protein